MSDNILKRKFFQHCLQLVDDRIAGTEKVIREHQLSANEETKSTSGDKYETGRAMAQLEIEKMSVQLGEARKMKQALLRIDPDIVCISVLEGSLVMTDQGNFLISVAAGILKADGKECFAISPVSPVAREMAGLTAGQTFVLNGTSRTIKKIY